MADRRVFCSFFKDGEWCVVSDGHVMSKYHTQADAENAALKAAKDIYEDGGLSQAIFYLKNHTLKAEQTYGVEPLRATG